MQAVTSTSNMPLSTKVILIAGEKTKSNIGIGDGPTPENVNSAVKEAEEKSAELLTTRETVQQTRRNVAVASFEAKNQQQSIERFIEGSTDTNVDVGFNTNLKGIAEISKTLKVNTAANAFNDSGIAKEDIRDFIQVRQREKLQNVIEGIGKIELPPSFEADV